MNRLPGEQFFKKSFFCHRPLRVFELMPFAKWTSKTSNKDISKTLLRKTIEGYLDSAPSLTNYTNYTCIS